MMAQPTWISLVCCTWLVCAREAAPHGCTPPPAEIDGAALITAVGVTSFVLCEAGSGKAVLRLTIPRDSVSQRVRAGVVAVPVTCVPPAGLAQAFVVECGGAA